MKKSQKNTGMSFNNNRQNQQNGLITVMGGYKLILKRLNGKITLTLPF